MAYQLFMATNRKFWSILSVYLLNAFLILNKYETYERLSKLGRIEDYNEILFLFVFFPLILLYRLGLGAMATHVFTKIRKKCYLQEFKIYVQLFKRE